jgi:hypothetical protein
MSTGIFEFFKEFFSALAPESKDHSVGWAE